MLLVDVDHFKAVNDTFGHHVGDAVLRHVARVLSAQRRPGDLIGRFGGEEFLVLTSDATALALAGFGERLRAAIEAASVNVDGRLHRVTVSLGGAVVPASAGSARFEAGIRAADGALYAAKRQGRNRVSMAAGVPEAAAGTQVGEAAQASAVPTTV